MRILVATDFSIQSHRAGEADPVGGEQRILFVRDDQAKMPERCP